MDADEFFNWMAYETLNNDEDYKKKLLEQVRLEGMDDLEKEAYLIKQMFMGITNG